MKTVTGLLALFLLALAAPAAAQPAERAPGKIVRLNGIDLHYRELGSGPPLLLLHGFGMCGEGDWGTIAAELAGPTESSWSTYAATADRPTRPILLPCANRLKTSANCSIASGSPACARWGSAPGV